MKNTRMLAGHTYRIKTEIELKKEFGQSEEGFYLTSIPLNSIMLNDAMKVGIFKAHPHCIDFSDSTYQLGDFWYCAEVFVDLKPKEILQEIIGGILS